jgi:hypothetical protein
MKKTVRRKMVGGGEWLCKAAAGLGLARRRHPHLYLLQHVFTLELGKTRSPFFLYCRQARE